MSKNVQVYAAQGLAVVTPQVYVLMVPTVRAHEMSAALAKVGFSRIAGSIFWRRGVHCAVVLPISPALQAEAGTVPAGPSGTWGRHEVIIVKYALANNPVAQPGVAYNTPATVVLGRIAAWLQGPTIHSRLRLQPQYHPGVTGNAGQQVSMMPTTQSVDLAYAPGVLGRVDARTFGHAHIHPIWLREWAHGEIAGPDGLGGIAMPRFFTTFEGVDAPPGVFSTSGIAAYMRASRLTRVELARRKFLLSLYPHGEGSGAVGSGETVGLSAPATAGGEADKPKHEVWYDSDGEEIPELLEPVDSSDDEM